MCKPGRQGRLSVALLVGLLWAGVAGAPSAQAWYFWPPPDPTPPAVTPPVDQPPTSQPPATVPPTVPPPTVTPPLIPPVVSPPTPVPNPVPPRPLPHPKPKPVPGPVPNPNPPPCHHNPEPATVLSGLIGAGLLGLNAWRRRKNV